MGTVEILGYEIHVKLKSDILTFLENLKAKGLDPEIELEKEGLTFNVKHPQGTRHNYRMKFYKDKIYEIMAYSEGEMNFLKETLKAL